MKRIIFLLISAAVCSFSSAFPIAVIDDGVLTGIDNLHGYDGKEYQVRFATGSFEDAFKTTIEDFRLDVDKNFDNVMAIHRQMFNFFSTEEIGIYYTYNPEYIYGCLSNRCNIHTPWNAHYESNLYNTDLSAVSRWRSFFDEKYWDPEFIDTQRSYGLKTEGDIFAVWNVVKVSEPMSILLLIPGIFLLFVSRRKEKPKATDASNRFQNTVVSLP